MSGGPTLEIRTKMGPAATRQKPALWRSIPVREPNGPLSRDHLARQMEVCLLGLALATFLPFAGGFGQEPRPALGLVDPDFDQAGRGHVAMFFAHPVRCAEIARELAVVVTQFS